MCCAVLCGEAVEALPGVDGSMGKELNPDLLAADGMED